MPETEITLEKIKEALPVAESLEYIAAKPAVSHIKWLIDKVEEWQETAAHLRKSWNHDAESLYKLQQENARLKELIPPTSEMTAFQAVIAQNHRLKEENTKFKKELEFYHEIHTEVQNIIIKEGTPVTPAYKQLGGES